jgi:hypothetical protein
MKFNFWEESCAVFLSSNSSWVCLTPLSVLFCSVDNSDYMRNGDFVPTRLQAQQDAVNMICHSKTRSNPENNVGLLTLTKYVYADELLC